MRNRRIGLVDIGLDDSFDTSMTFVQSIMSNINAGYDGQDGRRAAAVDVDFVRSRDRATIIGALTAQYSVLHVMAHGGEDQGEPYFMASDGLTNIGLVELAEIMQQEGQGLQVGAVLADGCGTATGTWKRAFRDCIQGDVTYIGTRGLIGWYEATVYAPAFYSALLRNRGKGVPPAAQALEAAQRASQAYEVITGGKCSYRAETLSPSARARKAFA